MRRELFEELVAEAMDKLPSEFAEKLDSIEVLVEDWPTSEQLSSVHLKHREELLGLYEGIPLTKRNSGLSSKLPDKITLFQRPIERISRTDDETITQIRKVLYHEVGHYFGISDERLEEIEREKGNDPW